MFIFPLARGCNLLSQHSDGYGRSGPQTKTVQAFYTFSNRVYVQKETSSKTFDLYQKRSFTLRQFRESGTTLTHTSLSKVRSNTTHHLPGQWKLVPRYLNVD